MTVRASRNIEDGEDITHTYVDPLDPILIRLDEFRQSQLYHIFFFLKGLDTFFKGTLNQKNL